MKTLNEEFRKWLDSEIEKHIILGSPIGALPLWMQSLWRRYQRVTGRVPARGEDRLLMALEVGQGYLASRGELARVRSSVGRYSKKTGKRFRVVQVPGGVEVLRVR